MTGRARATSRLVVVAIALLAAALLIAWGPASPAAAHDDLLSSEPADGAVLDAPPARVTLTYSAPVLAQYAQAAVQVPGGELQPLPGEALVAAGAVLTLDLTDMGVGVPAGTWTVVARIVSTDGHPVEEQVHFEAGPGPGTAGPAADPSTATSATQPTTRTQQTPAAEVSAPPVQARSDAPAPADAPARTDDAAVAGVWSPGTTGLVTGLGLAAVAVVAAAAVIGVRVAVRRR